MSPLPRDCLEISARSEEHTSELQSQSNLVCRLLLEKKNITPRSGPPVRIPRKAPRYLTCWHAPTFRSLDPAHSPHGHSPAHLSTAIPRVTTYMITSVADGHLCRARSTLLESLRRGRGNTEARKQSPCREKRSPHICWSTPTAVSSPYDIGGRIFFFNDRAPPQIPSLPLRIPFPI